MSLCEFLEKKTRRDWLLTVSICYSESCRAWIVSVRDECTFNDYPRRTTTEESQAINGPESPSDDTICQVIGELVDRIYKHRQREKALQEARKD